MPATKTDPLCSQHHRPLSECDPWNRHQHSNRFREDDWQATESTAKATGLATTALIERGMEVMQDYLRCDHPGCAADSPPIPVTFGDLTGKTFGEWVAKAAKDVRAQHPDHKPVTIGRQPSATGAAPERKAPRGRKAPAPVAAAGGSMPPVVHDDDRVPAILSKGGPATTVRFEDGTGEQAAW